MVRWNAAFAGGAIVCAAAGIAVADSDAQEALQRGRAALQTGDYEAACKAFEESYELEPAGETRFNLALCSEQLGKLATALHHYQELAKTERNPTRKSRSATAADALSKRVPRLRIEIGNKDKVVPAGFVVTVDGTRVSNFKDFPIDLGEHTVRAAASGHQNWEGVVEASWERETVIASVALVPGTPGPDILKMAPPPAPKRKPTPVPAPVVERPLIVDETPPASSGRRRAGIVLTASGTAVLAAGFVVGLLARSKYTAAKDVCGGTECDDPGELSRANLLVDDARLRGTFATALCIGGGVIAATGLVLWVTAPANKERAAVAVTPSTNGVSVSVFRRF